MCSFSWFSFPVLTASLLVPSSPGNTNELWVIKTKSTTQRKTNTSVCSKVWSPSATHPRVQSCSPEVLCVSWTRPERGDCSCSCQWCSSWCRPTGRSPSGSPCSNSPSCSADGQEPAGKEPGVIVSVAAQAILIFERFEGQFTPKSAGYFRCKVFGDMGHKTVFTEVVRGRTESVVTWYYSDPPELKTNTWWTTDQVSELQILKHGCSHTAAQINSSRRISVSLQSQPPPFFAELWCWIMTRALWCHSEVDLVDRKCHHFTNYPPPD